MKIVNASVVINGKKVRRYVVLNKIHCKICRKLFQPKTRFSLFCYDCIKNRNREVRTMRCKDEESFKKKAKECKDKFRHGGVRKQLLSTSCGKTCAMCGKEEIKSRHIHTHHINYDPTDHRPENQIQLCASCHGKEHFDLKRWPERKATHEYLKNITKEQVVAALKGNSLENAATSLGISRGAMWKLRKKHSLPKRKDGRKHNRSITRSKMERTLHLTAKEQGEVLGIKERSIAYYRKKFGLSNLPSTR